MIALFNVDFTDLQKDKSKCQLNTSGVTLNADLEPKMYHQPNTNDLYIWVQSFKTVATEMKIQGLHLKSHQRCSPGIKIWL